MKKSILCAFMAVAAAFGAFAGDAACFDDMGFSEDGKIYIFGQYGKTDRTYEAWAEIYTVDVARNDFVKGSVFKTKESGSEMSGKDAYDKLRTKAEWKLSSYKASKSGVDKLLYLRETDSKSETEEIVFREFNSQGNEYHIRLVPTYEGYKKNCRSKFYIDMMKTDASGNLLESRKLGTPDFMRKGVTGYKIDRIFTDGSGKSLVFIVQKTMEDDSGTSIRYMVETCELED